MPEVNDEGGFPVPEELAPILEDPAFAGIDARARFAPASCVITRAPRLIFIGWETEELRKPCAS